MAKWNQAELDALRRSSDYAEFGRLTGYTKSYDAWEVKRRRMPMVITDDYWSPLRLQRAVANNIRIARQVIRLRHSIEADDELADAIPLIRSRLQEQAQAGQVTGLTYDEMRQLIYGS